MTCIVFSVKWTRNQLTLLSVYSLRWILRRQFYSLPRCWRTTHYYLYIQRFLFVFLNFVLVSSLHQVIKGRDLVSSLWEAGQCDPMCLGNLSRDQFVRALSSVGLMRCLLTEVFYIFKEVSVDTKHQRSPLRPSSTIEKFCLTNHQETAKTCYLNLQCSRM